MLKLIILMPVVVVSLFVAGCATPYRPLPHEGGFPGGGYSSRPTGEDEFEIYFTGNRFTSLDRVKEYWHRRAGEVCAPGNYKVMDFSVQENPDSRSRPVVRGEVFCN